MRTTMINKFNVVISLWLIVVAVTLIVFGHQLNLYALYVAATVVGAVLLAMNVITIACGISSANKKAAQRQQEYRKF